MQIDLNRKMPKVTDLSERSFPPSHSYRSAIDTAERLGIRLNIDLTDYDELFWVAAVKPSFSEAPDRYDPRMRMGGKGQTREQCLASGSMEFIERWSMSRANMSERKVYPCLDLRTGKWYEYEVANELGTSKCLSAGNNFEEAILHSLHELIETMTPQHMQWKSSKVVDTQMLFPEFPQWVHDSVMLIQFPTERKEFYHFAAIQYPFNCDFDTFRPSKYIHTDNILKLMNSDINPQYHSPNSGGAAGLNPRLAAYRAMNEIFQFQKPVKDFRTGKKRPLPDYIPRAVKENFVNYETDSITGDINLILDILGEDVFVGVIDITDPDVGIPVVKVISDYSPQRSLVSREMMSVFFDF